jgi:ketosteroid isomerase-like protein
MTDQAPATDIAVAFLDAFARRDLSALTGYLADDVVFESPRLQVTGAKAVAAVMGQFAQAVTGVKVIAAFGDDREALLMYDMETVLFGTVRAADHLIVQDGKIKSDRLVFDTHEMRTAEAAQAPS